MAWGVLTGCGVLIVACILISAYLPTGTQKDPMIIEAQKITEEVISLADEVDAGKALRERIEAGNSKSDMGLMLYREPMSRVAVEWFYTHVVGDRDVALAILENAEKNDVPLSLAFSLAHTESNYKTRAKNVNTNKSIDRGLFQLNNQSFPKLTEEDFYNPSISAKYGMSHLRFCLDSAGNEIAALAMYNAGTNKVRNNKTPQMTLNYISQIEKYRSLLDANFNTEVLAFYSDGRSRPVANS